MEIHSQGCNYNLINCNCNCNENGSKGCESVNISSGDVNQIFSYLHFYNCRKTAYIFVPQAKIEQALELSYQNVLKKPDGLKIKIVPIALNDLTKSSYPKLENDIFTKFNIKFRSILTNNL